MIRPVLALAAAAMLFGMNAANATEWIHCSDATDHAQIGVLLGGDDFTNPITTNMRVGEQWWSTDLATDPSASPLLLGDYSFDWKDLHLTVTDEANVMLAEMRVVILESVDDIAKGGVLHVPGHGVWPVACVGP